MRVLGRHRNPPRIDGRGRVVVGKYREESEGGAAA